MTRWDAELYRERSSLQQTVAAEVLQALEVTISNRVLDVGCEDGRITSEIARRVPEGYVVGVDASSNMIELASEKIARNLYFAVVLTRARFLLTMSSIWWSRSMPCIGFTSRT
jgi:trans-aconitate 2-methyltransferase